MNRTEKKKLLLREKIISTTMELIGKNGYDETTMELIANEVDIAKATLYKYFNVKEAIISEYIEQNFKDKNPKIISKLENLSCTEERVTIILDTLLDGVKRSPLMFERYLVYQMKKMVQLPTKKQKSSGASTPINEVIRLGILSGEINKNLDEEFISEFFMFIFIEIVKAYFRTGEDEFKQLRLSYIGVFINSLK